MTRFIVALFCILLVILAIFLFLLIILPRQFGAYSVKDMHGGVDLVVLAIATFAGVVSNSVYERIVKNRTGVHLLRRRDVILAAVVAPIMMLPIYQTLQNGADLVILALTSYQNGFFFNTW